MAMRAQSQSLNGAHLLKLVGGAPSVAARHGLSAIIADDLDQPPAALASDARAQVAAGLKTKLLTLATIDALAQVGIAPVVLKGYALAVRLYRQPLARPSTDVDVLVSPAELPAAAGALTTLGLREVENPSLHDPFEEHHHVAFSGRRGLVEVHFRLFSGFGGGSFDELALRARLRPLKLDGRDVRVLGAEDEFLYLATHAANHGFLRLSWLLDLAHYLDKQPLDWSLMAARARAAGFLTAVAASLRTLERVLEVQLPAQATCSFPLSALRVALDDRVFSSGLVTSALLSNHWLGGFALRLWLVDSAAYGVRHITEGARRLARRSGA